MHAKQCHHWLIVITDWEIHLESSFHRSHEQILSEGLMDKPMKKGKSR
jgi:hypothetical protein